MGWWLKIARIKLLKHHKLFLEDREFRPWEKGLSYNWSPYDDYFDVHKNFHGKPPQAIVQAIKKAIARLNQEGIQLDPHKNYDEDREFWKNGCKKTGFLFILSEMLTSLESFSFDIEGPNEAFFATVDNNDCDHYVHTDGVIYTSAEAEANKSD